MFEKKESCLKNMGLLLIELIQRKYFCNHLLNNIFAVYIFALVYDKGYQIAKNYLIE